MEAGFERVLIESLESLELGESLDSVLARNPQYADELRPLLETERTFAQVKVAHSLSAQAQSRQRFLDKAAVMQNDAEMQSATTLFFKRLALIFVPLVLLLIVLAGSFVAASANTVPGDFLYDTKRNVEELRLSITSDPFARDQLREQYLNERINEIKRLLAIGRDEEVSFSGIIEDIQEGEWVVAGLHLIIDDLSTIEGTPMVGRFVWVEGKTESGRLIARSITIQFVPDVVPESDPTPQVDHIQNPDEPDPGVVIPSATPTSTNTPTPTAEPTATATIPEQSGGPAPIPTDTPTPTPADDNSGSEEDADDGNDNDDHDQNDDDNENEDKDENEDEENKEHENENEGEDDENKDNENDNDDDDDKDKDKDKENRNS